jgi:hypothetical protein
VLARSVEGLERRDTSVRTVCYAGRGKFTVRRTEYCPLSCSALGPLSVIEYLPCVRGDEVVCDGGPSDTSIICDNMNRDDVQGVGGEFITPIMPMTWHLSVGGGRPSTRLGLTFVFDNSFLHPINIMSTSTLSPQEVAQMAYELRKTVRELKDRGLIVAAKW